ncbi:MAG: hypothetical protein ISP01_02845 [Methanobrevibacter arboriphilus]|jgi:hypothetical protein|uniref:Uncharacterized protein n=2 Tax=Methanobrevibacter arboriphilus TaxID=39441 RepID=A0A843ABL1_METAZ|nr:hypothetical protein [Methanobrevibacter arboriphilus]MBF4468322.1 hypothetical protein [Methanobrevibacter arboriphilus]MCC7562109.1 hypothetical protein [Methanobrevibacter arboriphilus]BBL62045.1 hypothetical protein MarbSA_10850 [Methanobrevibacter arboriphilus]GLI11164.1 hypothetical protein MARBORIA2_02540 [Methanobrevibacter arboriphilus]
MKDLKSVKSIDLSSLTIIGTSISFIWSIVFSIIIIAILSLIIGRFDISFTIIGIGIIFGTLILSISKYFGISFLYNFFIKRMRDVKIGINNMESITDISILSLSLIVAVISLVVSIIIYPIIFLMLSFVTILYSLLQAISLQGFSWLVYPISLAFNPTFILYSFIISLVFTGIGAFIFNKISPKIGGLKVLLSKKDNMTSIDYINPKNAGIISGVICLVFGLIYGLIFSIISVSLPANLMLIVLLTIGGLIGGFIYGAISAHLYNFFSKKFSPVKIELKD